MQRGVRVRNQNIDPRKAVLNTAADMMLKTGRKELDMQKLSDDCGVKRSTIYAYFRRPGDKAGQVKARIFQTLAGEFMSAAEESIKATLAAIDPRNATPVEALAAVLRATLQVFKANELYGRVVLQQLNLARKDETALVSEIFVLVDKLIADARASGQLSPEAAQLENWKIRQTMFLLVHGLLRSRYLREGTPASLLSQSNTKAIFTDKEVIFLTLRVLQIFCSPDAQAKLTAIIDAVNKQNPA